MTDPSFRAQVRRWLEDNCPASMRTTEPPSEEVWGGSKGTFASDDARQWLERMAAKGWTAPTWPKRHGGGGLSDAEAEVLADEQRKLGCRVALRSLGIWLLGPVLMEYGSEAQCERFLPPVVRGQTRWCQGYSEPEAGSDLASLKTSAVLEGDHYVVNGQKVWTSHADLADWMFCLVRTDFAAPKREGISFLLIDMATPGIVTKPITLISGSSPFCETFFDHVRVPKDNLVGELNGGWHIAKTLLRYERGLISTARAASLEEHESLPELALRCVGRHDGRLRDLCLRDRIAQAEMDLLCSRLTLRRSKRGQEVGQAPGPETSILKLYGTELGKRRKELRVVAAGYRGIGWDGPGYSAAELAGTRQWLRSRASTIEGGTSEIQLNIIAKRVLGLPSG